jgi:predicted transcriptional regulator of viral defense system
MPTTETSAALRLFEKAGILRAKDAERAGISRATLSRLRARGLLERAGRGLYVLKHSPPSELRTLAEACQRAPKGVLCLLTALRFHGMTTENPCDVWLAIDQKARRPKMEYPPLRIVHFSGKSLTYGVQRHVVERTEVRVYSPAKTVADCFKFRHKLGIDVALAALRDCLRLRKATYDELQAAARVCRMSNVMRPYLEAVA